MSESKEVQMEEELTQEDWQQIAMFYRQKFADLELQVLALEIKLQKAQKEESEVAVA